MADDRDVVVALSSDGALTGYGRVPANPSVFALTSDGTILSVEYDTDSVAVVRMGEPIGGAGVADAARLVTMRSLLDEEADDNLDALTLDREMEQSLAAAAEPATVDCAAKARQFVLRLEDQLLGVSNAAAAALSGDCSAASDDVSLDAAETLARRMPGASVRELVEDDAFSRLLQAAASGDATARRLLGAALARIAIERGELDATAIAEETLRFGTNLPATILKTIAAGGAISPTLLDLVRTRSVPDPAAHQLFAHASERRINDVDSLTEALREYSIAERLYRDGGRIEEARFAAHRRAQLSRLLPDDRVLSVADAVEHWTPEMPDVTPETALPDLPAEPAARRSFNMENANKLSLQVPNSLLLDALRTEMERARIVDLRTEDPKAAADLLIDLGRRGGAASGWSADLVREYLDLADGISDGPAGGQRLPSCRGSDADDWDGVQDANPRQRRGKRAFHPHCGPDCVDCRSRRRVTMWPPSWRISTLLFLRIDTPFCRAPMPRRQARQVRTFSRRRSAWLRHWPPTSTIQRAGRCCGAYRSSGKACS